MPTAMKIAGTYCESPGVPKSSCAPGSYRWTGKPSRQHPGQRVWVLTCCPRGKWGGRRCGVGLKAHRVLSPTSKCPCPAPKRCVVKGD